jgi:hypothetical protein
MAVKMQAEYGDNLNTIFVESQGHTMDDVRKLALEKKWFGTNAMWTKERPVRTDARGIPNFVLLSPEGEVVLMGHPGSMHKQIEDYIKSLRRGSKPPKDLHKDLKGIYKNYAKGKLGAAINEAKKLEAKAQDDEVKAACSDLLSEMTKVADAAVSRLERATAEGAYSFVRRRAKDLSKSLKGTEYEQKITEQLKQLDDKSLAGEIKAEKDLAKIERKLYSKGAEPAIKKALKKFAGKHAGTKAAKRAEELADAIE